MCDFCLLGRGGGERIDGDEDEIDDGVGEEGDGETEDGVEDGVFGVGDLLAVAAGKDVAEAAPNEHKDRDGTNGIESDIRKTGEDAFRADELGGHTVGAGGFSAFLDGEGHNFAGTEGEGGAQADDEL